jgi:acyl carrier protein
LKVTGAVKDILGVELTAEAPLMASGLDSLGATDLRKGLVDKTGLELPSTLVFDYPTISALSDFIRPQIFELPGTATHKIVAGMEAPRAVVQAQPDVHLSQSTGLTLAKSMMFHPRVHIVVGKALIKGY